MSAPKLTAAQRKRVRELMVDEGQTRAEAVAWVLAFEPAARLTPEVIEGSAAQ